ncbi:DegT/DnrJ/EryC1/StrS family aminotransferase [uncultured Roseovarius sp.]|uniref:DegT/DnrJ/EryC1/StrS family aminotransferase n=1 Tax=uncultured Roseovarius sp. TaxID=293344 RepID=UPI0026122DFC|nr:DegT/DnrJ/EryC1/StrS family aminotransferase [uncultured Roseovarius sp.]
MIKFVENKTPAMDRVATLLEACAQENTWANRGPLYHTMADVFGDHLQVPSGATVTPCANGGVALEAMARLHEQDAGRPLRWVSSSFTFQNMGRGYFADVTFVDCDASGMLDIAALRALDPESYDGFVVVNTLGMVQDFSAYISFARESGKAMLFDNAAGVRAGIPDWPWQSFSLHQTKPYGVGEGGLAITPADRAEEFYTLLNYDAPPEPAGLWMNNGKISDIACAFHISRLELVDDWTPQYYEQEARIAGIAQEMGLRPLLPVCGPTPKTSCAFLCDTPIPLERLRQTQNINFAKYYKPLAQLSMTQEVYAHILNIPTHPDMAQATRDQIIADLKVLMTGVSG